MDDYLSRAAAFGSGIRILNQDLWEMIITFIISQQKTILIDPGTGGNAERKNMGHDIKCAIRRLSLDTIMLFHPLKS